MTSNRSRLSGLVAAALVAAAGLVGLSAQPAAAAFCSGAGVNVVVDFKGLGGGVQKGCDPNGAGKSGDKVFPAAGFKLDYVTNSGFVCRVKAKPGGNVCSSTPPTSAYWGLYWSDGKSGWKYSNVGVGGISVPSGGFLAFSWQNGGANQPPGTAPANNQPDPTPTKAPTKAPTKTPTKAPGDGAKPTKTPKPTRTPAAAGTTAPTATASATASASAGAEVSASASASPSASASSSPSDDTTLEPSVTDDASPAAASVEGVDDAFTPKEDSNGLPVWVPVTVILALAGAAGGAVWWRRRTGAA